MMISRKHYLYYCVAPVIFLFAAVSCGQDTETVGRNEVKFYSAADPGPWTEQAADHEPEVTITRVDDRKILNVSIPFARQGDKQHYVEVIVLLDLDRKQIRKVSFEKGRASKGAKFDFPENYSSPVYVVMKCNRHDMWEKLVDWSE